MRFMNIFRPRCAAVLVSLGLLSACGGGGGGGDSTSTSTFTSADTATMRKTTETPIKLVSTPNPNVFPLLLAMARNPSLAVQLIPAATGGDIDTAFATGKAEALLSMTYTAAQKVTSAKVPDLQLVQSYFWRGFSLVSPSTAGITSFDSLVGKGIIISGPTSGGKGGGPDFIFQAAVKRSGHTMADFHICYLPVMQGAPMLSQQQLMNSNTACDPSFAFAPSAISLVEPAATGLQMQTLMNTSGGASLSKAIDVQTLFTGYTAWPASQLPHGGLSARKAVFDDATRAAVLTEVNTAYVAAVQEINAAITKPTKLADVSKVISAGITTYYGQYGLDLPAAAIGAALMQKELMFRSDLGNTAVKADLQSFLNEVVGSTVPDSFYR
jgi:ABC-type nitrate/sulfonate/bicarbonate transport system substrate-binding protein